MGNDKDSASREPKAVTECLLNDGTITIYDACTTKEAHPDVYDGLIYLGSGVVYSRDGIKQEGKIIHRFYRKPPQ